MAGVVPGAARKDEEKKKLLPVTPLGRYLKVLLQLERVPVLELIAMPHKLPPPALSEPIHPHRRVEGPVSRRDALCRIGNGFGMLAFAGLVGDSLDAAALQVAKAAKVAQGARSSSPADCIIRRRPSTSSSSS